METRDVEYRDGFLLVSNRRLRTVSNREAPAATHLIAGFPFPSTDDGLAAGTVVWFKGNTTGFKAPGGVELGPGKGGARQGDFWWNLDQERDLQASMRIDRQNYINNGDKRFCNYHLQVGNESLACVLVLVDVHIGTTVMRRAFNLSLQTTKNVWIDPTNENTGWPHVKR